MICCMFMVILFSGRSTWPLGLNEMIDMGSHGLCQVTPSSRVQLIELVALGLCAPSCRSLQIWLIPTSLVSFLLPSFPCSQGLAIPTCSYLCMPCCFMSLYFVHFPVSDLSAFLSFLFLHLPDKIQFKTLTQDSVKPGFPLYSLSFHSHRFLAPFLINSSSSEFWYLYLPLFNNYHSISKTYLLIYLLCPLFSTPTN